MAKSRSKAPVRAKAPESSGQLIVLMEPTAGVSSSGGVLLASADIAEVSSLNEVLSKAGASFIPLFGPEQRVAASPGIAELSAEIGMELSGFYTVETKGDKEKLAKELLKNKAVAAAYVKPIPEPPVMLDMGLSAAPPNENEPTPPVTPNFVGRQLYLNAAPGGIDALYAHTLPGGKGDGIRIIDIEGAWRYSHEDLMANQGGVIGGTQSTALGWRNHGTAVIGEFGGDENGKGVTGISPNANVRSISIFGENNSSAKAIKLAADSLSAGDIILIELHAPGPFATGVGQFGFIAMEWWPDDFAAIKYATNKGVIVIEAAGNGSQNYDVAGYNTRPAGFPLSWKNPFNMANPQSGAILVGAGAPPPGTHGRNHGADRSRLDFSNYGARVDVQGWGREVTTCGYGDLQGGGNEDFWYTDEFSGTSSASPIVVGAVACIQGRLKNRGKALLTPATATNLLRTTGSPQQNEPGRPTSQRIGNRPNLKQAFSTLGVGKFMLKDGIKDHKEFKEKEFKEFKEFKENKEFKEIKEFDKRIGDKNPKELVEKIRDVINERFDHVIHTDAGAEGVTMNTEDRIAQLEQAVSQLQHFISGNDRPDLVSNLPEF